MFFLVLALMVVATGIVGALVLPIPFFLMLALAVGAAVVTWGIVVVVVAPIWKSE